MAYDLNATVVAHSVNFKLIGKTMFEVPDADGKLFRKEIVETVKAKRVGWGYYKYKNPVNDKVGGKTTYLKKAGGLILCCGVYK